MLNQLAVKKQGEIANHKMGEFQANQQHMFQVSPKDEVSSPLNLLGRYSFFLIFCWEDV